MKNIFDYTVDELTDCYINEFNQKKYRAVQTFKWLYQENESLAKRLLFDHIRAENQDLIRQYEYKIDSALKRISNAERILLANSQ